ncbi:adenylate/guanylate cyclase domain-containing protein [Streptomyces sp. NPDC026665]|uniref:adenylate/guanylate cyclase domain-containing protein n=1 Tax=Streptomyces sp. NPDC026665 TaxID=3154798 RepID=UPI0033DA772D
MTVDDTGSGTGAHPAPGGEPGRTAGPVTDATSARAAAAGEARQDAGTGTRPNHPNHRPDDRQDVGGGRPGDDRYATGSDPRGDGQGGGARPDVRPDARHEANGRVDPQAEPESEDDPLALRLEGLILGAERRYTPFQAARSAGVSMELASRFWRAMGFADIGQAKALTEADVLALRRLAGLVEAGLLSEAMAVQVARSTGQTTARLAEWQIDSFLEGLTEPPEPGMTRTEVTYPLIELLLPELEEFLVYVWRRQLAAATGRVVQAADDEEMVDRRLAVGFADLVGFTRLTRRMEEEELGELVEAFETTAADLVAAHGGRLIKTLGDEVLYSADDAGVAAEIALRLIETMANDETMPELRVGIAFGTVTTRMGDVFGTTVNLASRLTSIAPRDAVLVDGAFAEELTRTGDAPASEAEAAEAAAAAEKEGEEPPSYRFALQPMWQRPVRGLGVIEPWLLARRSDDA